MLNLIKKKKCPICSGPLYIKEMKTGILAYKDGKNEKKMTICGKCYQVFEELFRKRENF